MAYEVVAVRRVLLYTLYVGVVYCRHCESWIINALYCTVDTKVHSRRVSRYVTIRYRKLLSDPSNLSPLKDPG